jgi:hypothetical protein
VHFAAALVVSDELSTLKWVHGFREKRFKDSRECLAEAALEFIASMSQNQI